MITRKSIVLGLCLALSSGAVLAKPGHGPKLPEEYDLNDDGTITEEEIQTARTAEFTAIDTSQDGYINVAEVRAWLDRKQTDAFNKLDTDQSGSLSQTEFVGSATGREARKAGKAFKFGDTDGDSALSLAEFKALKPVSTGEVARMFDMLDTDDDDRISEEEYLTVPTPPAHGGGRGGQGGPGGFGGGGRGPGGPR